MFTSCSETITGKLISKFFKSPTPSEVQIITAFEHRTNMFYLGTPGKALEELYSANSLECFFPHCSPHITIHVRIRSEAQEEVEGNVKWPPNLHFEDSALTFF